MTNQPKFSHNVEVIWKEDLSGPLLFIVNGRRITPSKRTGTSDYIGATDNMRLIEDLFVEITMLRAKILLRHC